MMLSVIVPVYNKEKYLDECILSIVSQSFIDFELILVNDGSTDNCLEICRRYEKIDNRIVVLDQANAGVSAARNAGLKIAKGKYIGFIDGDDFIDSDMYQTLVNNAEEHTADISVCRLKTVFPFKTEAIAEDNKVKVLQHAQALKLCLRGDLDRSANNKIYLATLAQKYTFEGSLNEDILYTAKLFIEANKTVLVNRMLYNYVVRDNSASMKSFSRNYMQITNVSANILELVAKKDKENLVYAKEFDVLGNLSILNLILLAGKSNYKAEYSLVVQNLKKHLDFINNAGVVRKKHRYAINLFNLSPLLYSQMMRAYCWIFNSEALKRA